MTFKSGDVVICVNDSGYVLSGLVLGGLYEVEMVPNYDEEMLFLRGVPLRRFAARFRLFDPLYEAALDEDMEREMEKQSGTWEMREEAADFMNPQCPPIHPSGLCAQSPLDDAAYLSSLTRCTTGVSTYTPINGNVVKYVNAGHLTSDSDARKDVPMATGLLDYFPDALADVARLSKIGNDKHNPGQPIQWARNKSQDHADCILRHMTDRGVVDTDGVLHDTKVAWRALAQLQLALEKQRDHS